jgi:hypothetical protein
MTADKKAHTHNKSIAGKLGGRKGNQQFTPTLLQSWADSVLIKILL